MTAVGERRGASSGAPMRFIQIATFLRRACLALLACGTGERTRAGGDAGAAPPVQSPMQPFIHPQRLPGALGQGADSRTALESNCSAHLAALGRAGSMRSFTFAFSRRFSSASLPSRSFKFISSSYSGTTQKKLISLLASIRKR